MNNSFDGIEWRPLRAAMILGSLATQEFDRRPLTPNLSALAGKSLGALKENEAGDEASFRDALAVVGISQKDIERLTAQVLDVSEDPAQENQKRAD